MASLAMLCPWGFLIPASLGITSAYWKMKPLEEWNQKKGTNFGGEPRWKTVRSDDLKTEVGHLLVVLTQLPPFLSNVLAEVVDLEWEYLQGRAELPTQGLMLEKASVTSEMGHCSQPPAKVSGPFLCQQQTQALVFVHSCVHSRTWKIPWGSKEQLGAWPWVAKDFRKENKVKRLLLLNKNCWTDCSVTDLIFTFTILKYFAAIFSGNWKRSERIPTQQKLDMVCLYEEFCILRDSAAGMSMFQEMPRVFLLNLLLSGLCGFFLSLQNALCLFLPQMQRRKEHFPCINRFGYTAGTKHTDSAKPWLPINFGPAFQECKEFYRLI